MHIDPPIEQAAEPATGSATGPAAEPAGGAAAAPSDRPVAGPASRPAARPAGGIAILADGLRCRYGDFEAVAGVSFDVREGELCALLGTNGAGKTTTLETLEGVRPAHAGTVRVLGRDPYRERRAVRPRVGIMMAKLGESNRVADVSAAQEMGWI